MVKQTKYTEYEQKSSPQRITHPSAYHEVKTLLAWEGPGRPFKKRTRSYYATILIILFFIEVLLFLFSDYPAMLVAASVAFVAFALASVPPHDFHYRISSEGIFIEDHFTLWQELYDFYKTKQNGQDVIILRTRSLFPGELTLTHGDLDINTIKSTLLPYLPFREYIKPTFTDKAGNWLSKNFPLEPVPLQKKTTVKTT